MAGTVLILRPQPGADRSAEKARALGLEPAVAPLFVVRSVEWRAPDPAGFDAVMLTSANALRQAGPQLRRFLHLPGYAVGETTAAAAREAGFREIATGPADAEALAAMMLEGGIRRAFHPSGADRTEMDVAGLSVDRRAVYASEAVGKLPAAAREALASGALALLHSPRAMMTFGRLCDEAGMVRASISIAAISAVAATAAGPGWARTLWAAEPRDQALLELAAKLCNSAASRD